MQPDLKFIAWKRCLFGLALLVYLASTFHEGILEITHAWSHQLTSGHSFRSHHVAELHADHDHPILDSSKKAIDGQDESPVSPNDKPKLSFDKIFHVYLPETLPTSPVELKKKEIPSFDLQLPATPYLQILTPPPDLAA